MQAAIKSGLSAAASLTTPFKIAKTKTAIEARKTQGYLPSDIQALQEFGILTKGNVVNYTAKVYATKANAAAILNWIAEGEKGGMPEALGRALCDKAKLLRNLSLDASNHNKVFASKQIGRIAAYLESHGYDACEAVLRGYERPPSGNVAAGYEDDEDDEPLMTNCNLQEVMDRINQVRDELMTKLNSLDRTGSASQTILDKLGEFAPSLQGRISDEMQELKRREIEASIEEMGRALPEGGGDTMENLRTLLKSSTPESTDELQSLLAQRAAEGTKGAAAGAASATELVELQKKEAAFADALITLLTDLRKNTAFETEFPATPESSKFSDVSIKKAPYDAAIEILRKLGDIRAKPETTAVAEEAAKAATAVAAAAESAKAVSSATSNISGPINTELLQGITAIQDALKTVVTSESLEKSLAPFAERFSAIDNVLRGIGSNVTTIKNQLGSRTDSTVQDALKRIESLLDGRAAAATATTTSTTTPEEIAKMKADITSLDERIRRLESQRTTLAAEATSAGAGAGAATSPDAAALKALNEEIAKLTEERDALKARLSEAEKAAAAAAAAAPRVRALETDLATARGETAAARAEVEGLQRRIAALEKELTETRATAATAAPSTEEARRLQEASSAIQAQLATALEGIRTAETARDRTQAELAAAQAELAAAQAVLAAAQTELAAARQNFEDAKRAATEQVVRTAAEYAATLVAEKQREVENANARAQAAEANTRQIEARLQAANRTAAEALQEMQRAIAAGQANHAAWTDGYNRLLADYKEMQRICAPYIVADNHASTSPPAVSPSAGSTPTRPAGGSAAAGSGAAKSPTYCDKDYDALGKLKAYTGKAINSNTLQSGIQHLWTIACKGLDELMGSYKRSGVSRAGTGLPMKNLFNEIDAFGNARVGTIGAYQGTGIDTLKYDQYMSNPTIVANYNASKQALLRPSTSDIYYDDLGEDKREIYNDIKPFVEGYARWVMEQISKPKPAFRTRRNRRKSNRMTRKANRR
jgi:predicted  nucleic acid-binding Zn-ribbon protein